MKPLNTWSPLSNVTVSLKRSKDYQKLLCVLYAITLMAILTAHFAMLLTIGLVVFISGYFLRLSRLGTPGVACIQVKYFQQHWQMHTALDQFEKFETVRVKFDFGWLMWLCFKKKTATQHLLLFSDQISPNDHRLLRVLLRVLA